MTHGKSKIEGRDIVVRREAYDAAARKALAAEVKAAETKADAIESFKGRKNIYTCPNGHFIVTVDRDAGVTPFATRCKTPGCGCFAQSSMYHVFDQRMRASWEWYRPGPAQKLTPGQAEHVSKGGLLLRPIPLEDN